MDASSGWAGWFQVSGGRAALSSRVEMVARNPDRLDRCDLFEFVDAGLPLLAREPSTIRPRQRLEDRASIRS
ncbi:MAG TPA: hypothetical protein VFD59_16380 [Nocardioidaceae bacterium]|nr:hypothetical protein [Nocardioidaceae bacterium]